MLEHALERATRTQIMNQMITEFGKLIEYDVFGILIEPPALVVDLLDVRFGAGCADDVAWIRHPLIEPAEALLAHARRKHRDAAAPEDARDGDAAAAVVS